MFLHCMVHDYTLDYQAALTKLPAALCEFDREGNYVGM